MSPPHGLDSIVERYIALRDLKARKKAAYEAEARLLDEAMSRIETFLLAQLNGQGAESVRTGQGTFFKSRRTNCTVADWDATLPWIITNEAWSMLEKRVSKSFVEQYREEHNDLPPGLNYSEEVTINVRRS